MKKFLIVFALTIGIAVAHASTVHAEDYYVGTSNVTGMKCFLMTHTVAEIRHYSDGGRFSARLKMVGKNIQYLDYELDIGTSGYTFRNSAGYSGEVTPDGTPIEWNMCTYIAENFLRL